MTTRWCTIFLLLGIAAVDSRKLHGDNISTLYKKKYRSHRNLVLDNANSFVGNGTFTDWRSLTSLTAKDHLVSSLPGDYFSYAF